MKTLKVLTIVAITGLVGITAVNACPQNADAMCPKQTKCDKPSKHYNKGEMEELYKQLDLTTDQQSAMKTLRESMREQRNAQRKNMQSQCGMSAMGQFVSAEGFDKQGFIDMATQKSKDRIEMKANMLEQKMNILTPVQRAKLASLLQEKK
ncbi:Spy/CpxP family protein refolding chaperone [Sulfurovum sp.]|uniref:Spy/CpxP family protein refolding chaperone n=1 Tax=Sulfurovum sp. TaxID=1969726 RepID=UPI0028681D73|nr:Spy/CpxP family protein refolding chaperone [Sulfurovum sp.]